MYEYISISWRRDNNKIHDNNFSLNDKKNGTVN